MPTMEETTPLMLENPKDQLPDSQQPATTTLPWYRKMSLTAAFTANDMLLSFQLLYQIPLLQMMGVPVVLMSLYPLVEGPVALVYLLLLSYVGDRGSGHRYRKVAVVVVTFAVLLTSIASLTVSDLMLVYCEDRFDDDDDNVEPSAGTNASSVTHANTSTSLGIANSCDQVPIVVVRNGSVLSGAEPSSDGSGLLDLPVTAVLGLVGCALLDLGYDSNCAFMRVSALACSPKADHSFILSLALVMSAVGGCFTPVLSLLDLTPVFGAAKRSLVTQTSALLLLFYAVTVFLVAGTVTTSLLNIRDADNDRRDAFPEERTGDPGKDRYEENEALLMEEREEVDVTGTMSDDRNEQFSDVTRTMSDDRIEQFSDVTGNEQFSDVTGTMSDRNEQFSDVTGNEQFSDVTGTMSDRDEQFSDVTGTMSDDRNEQYSDVTGTMPDRNEQFSDVTGTMSDRDEQFSDVTGNEQFSDVIGTISDRIEQFSDVTGNEQFSDVTGTMSNDRNEQFSDVTGERTRLTPACHATTSYRLRSKPTIKARFTASSLAQATGSGERPGIRITLGEDSSSVSLPSRSPDSPADDSSARGGRQNSRCGLHLLDLNFGLLCATAFLAFSVYYSFFMYASDFLGTVVMEGDSTAPADSAERRAYEYGVSQSAGGVIVFCCSYASFGLSQNKLQTRFGRKRMFCIPSFLMSAAILLLLLTRSWVAYYVSCVAFGLQRSAAFSIPYIVANDYVHNKMKEEGLDDKNGSIASRLLGLVTGMLPLYCCTLYLLSGPLISMTSYHGAPPVVACVCSFLAAVLCAFNPLF